MRDLSRGGIPAQLCSKANDNSRARTPAPDPVRWLNNQPYLLLSLTSLFWAGNIVLARYVAGHVPPMTLSCVRWIGAFAMLLPFAWPHLKQDWPALRARLPLMVGLSATGFAFNNAISYWALQYTEALNALLIQSSGPLFVALWSLLLFGIRLTWAQLAGIAISLAGVLTILLRGDLAALVNIQFNRGDVMFAGAVLSFGLYSALITRRPKIHQLSLISFTIGCGALLLLPFSIWEFSAGVRLKPDALTLATVDLRHDLSIHTGLSVLQPRHRADRAEPRLAVPASGAGIRLGDGDPAARRAAAAVPSDGISAGAGRRGDRLKTRIGRSLSCGAVAAFVLAPGRLAWPARNPSEKPQEGSKGDETE